jgi:hypothetical protein
MITVTVDDDDKDDDNNNDDVDNDNDRHLQRWLTMLDIDGVGGGGRRQMWRP